MEHYTIATVAEESPDFRRVLWTGEHTQLVVMTIPPGGEIGEEVHEDIDQILTSTDTVTKRGARIEALELGSAAGEAVADDASPQAGSRVAGSRTGQLRLHVVDED